MSRELVEQLNDATTKVNATINQILSGEGEPEALYKATRHLIDAGGKRLRPFLALKSCEIVGGQVEHALPAAAAIELLHNFTLIHDDIMDGDSKRRGVPTVHVLWGIPMAINAGDLLFAKVYEALFRHTVAAGVPLRRVFRVAETLTEATIAICEGQALDMLFEERETVSEEEYFKMIEGKTATLIRASAKSGAMIGGGKPSQVQRLGNFAYYSGLAFQIVDDVLGLTADEKVLGKPVGSDIREGKRTLIIAYALSRANEKQRGLILSTLGDRNASAERTEDVRRTINSLGAIEYASERAERLVEKAKLQLSPFPDTSTKNALLDLSDFIISRSS